MVDTSHQNTALEVIVAFPILGGIAVLLRLWSRYLSRSALSSDDYLISAAYIFTIAQTITSLYWSLTIVDVKTNYTGIHIWEVPKDFNMEAGLVWNYAYQLLYNPCLTLVKVSILMFLRRLESKSRVVQTLIWVSLAVTISLCIAVLLVDLFQCRPVAYVYDQSIPGGTCINQGAFYISTAAFNLFTDLLVLSIPIIITCSLHMPIRRKIAVCVILCLGVVAIEVNVGVLCACAPSMKAITSKYLPRLLGTSRQGTYRYERGSDQHRSGKSPQLPIYSSKDYDVSDPYGPQVDIKAEDHEMRKYTRRDDSPSLSSDEGTAGIVKRTDVSIYYGSEDQRSHTEVAGVDSWV